MSDKSYNQQILDKLRDKRIRATLGGRLWTHDIQINDEGRWLQIWIKDCQINDNLNEDNVQAVEDLTIEYANKLRELLVSLAVPQERATSNEPAD